MVSNDPAYMKEYYTKEKKQFTQMLKKKESCRLCGRTTSHQFMTKHQETNICKRSRKPDPIACKVMFLEENTKQLKNQLEKCVCC